MSTAGAQPNAFQGQWSGPGVLQRWNAQRKAERAVQQRGHLPVARGARGPFVAASFDRLTASWLAGRQSINEALRSDLDTIIMRSGELARNNGYAKRFLRMVERNVIGPGGVVLQARAEDAPGKPDSVANAAIEEAWWYWGHRGSAEITGRMSWLDTCRAVLRAVVRDGGALAREIHGPDARNEVGFALQLISMQRLDTQKNRAPGAGQNAIIMGVEVDSYLRPLAYWIKDKVSGGVAQRYPADGIHHVYLCEEAEQVRGLPWMHAALVDLHDLGEFNRSALLAARKGADTVGFITSPTGGVPDDLMGEGQDGEAINISAPGTFDVLPDGYTMQAFDSRYPNDTFDPFTKAILRRISSGFDVNYNSLGNDLEGVNYSSLRSGALEERDAWMQVQDWFVNAFVEPVYHSWFSKAMLAGTIRLPGGAPLPVAKADKFAVHEWQPRRWAWVDPLKDIAASREAVRLGVASPQMVAAQNGVDVEDVLDSIAAFEAMCKERDISLIDYSGRTGGTGGTGAQSSIAGAATEQADNPRDPET